MAKTKKTTSPAPSGPFLSSAVFCDNVLKDDDGAMTAVRMIDRVTISVPSDAPADLPSEDKQLLTQVEGLVAFKTGDSPGKHEIKLVLNSPSGKRQAVMAHPAEFRAEPFGGFNLKLKMGIAVQECGLHWMDVLLDDRLMTRMPLLISLRRAEASDESHQTEKSASRLRAKKK